MTAWVTRHCRVSTSTARQWVTVAAHLESLPCLGEGLASGELSLDLVSSLAEVATSETDAELRRESAHWSVRQARELAAWYKAQQEADDPPGAGNGRKPEATSKPDDENGEGSHETLGPGLGSSSGARSDSTTPDVRSGSLSRRTTTRCSSRRWSPTQRPRSERTTPPITRRQYHEYLHYDQRLYDTLMHVIDRGARPDNGAGPRAPATGADPNPPAEGDTGGSHASWSPSVRPRPP